MPRLSASPLRRQLACALALLALAAPVRAQLAPADAAAQMGRGINLGNTLEPPTEGAWNNAPAQESLFEAYREAGFSTVRVPVRWDQHMGRSAPFTIDEAWLSRVEQVVDWGLERDLFVILNAHHDDWLKLDYDNPTLQARFDSLWSQVATRFQDKSDKLLFEIFNEPFEPMTLAQTNDMNARVLPLIRRTNPTRLVLYSGASYSSLPQLIAADVPDDPYVMGYYHSYDPYEFGLLGQSTWGSAADRATLSQAFDRIASWSQATGVPVVLSEFGAIRTADYNSRMRHYAAFVVGALEAGIPFQAWDDGGDFRIYDRPAGEWEDVKDILISTDPDGPNRFRATLQSDTLAALAWDAPSGSAGLDVQRRTEGSDWETIAQLASDVTAYTDTLGTAPRDYTYRVISRSLEGPDAYSYPQEVRVLPTRRAPFGGTPVALPGTVEAEDYDAGGEGLTYHDADADNVTGAYRPDEGVDIEARADGGYHVAYVEPGEWIEYTVDVPETARYTLTAYVASLDGGGEFTISASASTTGVLVAPRTGGWETFVPVTASVRLGAGEKVLRFQVRDPLAAPFNFDRMVIERSATATDDGPSPAIALQARPNPARQRVVVTRTGPAREARLEIVDALGRQVRSLRFEGVSQEVDVAALPAGIYLVRLESDGETLARTRFVVVR